MVRVNREEKNWLIKNGYISLIRGRYNGLTVCNRCHNSNSKTYYVTDDAASYLSKRQKV